MLLALPALALQDAGGPATAAPDKATADAAMAAGTFSEAAPIYAQLVEAEPGNAELWFRLGYCLHAQGQHVEALPAHQQAAERATGRMQQVATYNVACAHARLGHTDQAFTWLARAREVGFTDNVVATDADLVSLHDDPRWRELVPESAVYDRPFAEDDVVVLHEWTGEAAGDQFGWVALDAGDCDGDGVHDAVVGAPFHGTGGKAYVYSGRSGALLFTVTGDPGDQLGKETNAAGDVDGDGHDDVLLGAPGWNAGTGRVLVCSGTDGSVLLTLEGTAPGGNFGSELDGPGDLDADGVPDFVVGAFLADAARGRVTVHSGKDGSVLTELRGRADGEQFGSAVAGYVEGPYGMLAVGAMEAGPTKGGRVSVYRLEPEGPELHFDIEAEPSNVSLGRFFLSFVGDVDADHVPDVYAPDFDDGNGGRVYVHSGRDGTRLHDFIGQREGLGIGDAECGDVDGDGHDDLIVGAWVNSEYAAQAGKAYLYSGRDGSVLRTFTSTIAGDTFGFDAVGLGDVDGDGSIDFLITSAWNDAAGDKAGRVYVISGTPGEVAEG